MQSTTSKLSDILYTGMIVSESEYSIEIEHPFTYTVIDIRDDGTYKVEIENSQKIRCDRYVLTEYICEDETELISLIERIENFNNKMCDTILSQIYEI